MRACVRCLDVLTPAQMRVTELTMAEVLGEDVSRTSAAAAQAAATLQFEQARRAKELLRATASTSSVGMLPAARTLAWSARPRTFADRASAQWRRRRACARPPVAWPDRGTAAWPRAS